MSDWESAPFGTLYAVPSKNGLMAPSRVRGSGVALINMRELFAYDRIGDVPMELAPLPEKSPDEWLVQRTADPCKRHGKPYHSSRGTEQWRQHGDSYLFR